MIHDCINCCISNICLVKESCFHCDDIHIKNFAKKKLLKLLKRNCLTIAVKADVEAGLYKKYLNNF